MQLVEYNNSKCSALTYMDNFDNNDTNLILDLEGTYTDQQVPRKYESTKKGVKYFLSPKFVRTDQTETSLPLSLQRTL